MKHIITLFFTLICINLFAQPIPPWHFGITHGSTNQDSFDDIDITTHYKYKIGSWQGTTNYKGNTLISSGTGSDVLIAKINNFDVLISHITIPCTESISRTAIAIEESTDDIIVAITYSGSITFGSTTLNSIGNSDIALAKYSQSSGTWLYAVSMGGTGLDYAWNIDVKNGRVGVVGFFSNTADFLGTNITSNGGHDAFVSIHNVIDGSLEYVDYFGSGWNDETTSITFDSFDSFYITGNFRETVNPNGTSLTSVGASWDSFLIKYNSTGNIIFAKGFGSNVISGSTRESGRDLVVNETNGQLVLTGYFLGNMDIDGNNVTSQGDIDIYIASFDTNTGNNIFVRSYGSNSYDSGTSICLGTGSGAEYFLFGFFRGSVDFDGTIVNNTAGGRYLFITALDASANVLDVKTFGNAQDPNIAEKIVYGGAGSVSIVGSFSSNCDFASPTTFNSNGNRDAFFQDYLPLGIQLSPNDIDFSGQIYYNYNRLEWEFITPNPIFDIEKYILERYNPNISDFEIIKEYKNDEDFIPDTLYEYIDINPVLLPDNSYIYRLRIIKKDGSEETKEVILKEKQTEPLTPYPIPSNGIFNIEVPALHREYYVHIHDLTGKLVYEKHIDDFDEYGRQSIITIDLSNLTNGVYVGRLIVGNDIILIKQLVLKK